jgi:hypothetical protein
MNKLEVSFKEFGKSNESAGDEDNSVQQSMLAFLTDCAVIYSDRVLHATDSGAAVDLIPERVVPQILDPADPRYLQEVQITCSNEKGDAAGRFGWCIICRKAASYYCKDTRFPICSSECKLKYIEAEQNFDRKDQEYRRSAFQKKKQAVDDCISMFKSFMRHAFQGEGK